MSISNMYYIIFYLFNLYCLPSVATELIGTPCLCDMNPKYVNITNPEKNDVKQLTAVVTKQSLKVQRDEIIHT